MKNLIKYLAEGLALSLVVYLTMGRKLKLMEFAQLAVVVVLSFALLDYLAPRLSYGARMGSGFGIGATQVGGTKSFTDTVKGFFGATDNDTTTSFGTDAGACGSNLKPEIIQEIDLTPVPDNTGACQMKPYLNDATRAEEYAEVLEESDDILQVDPVITETPAGKCPHMPYKIIPGQWSEEDLIAGYNESVTAANACTGYWTGFT